MLERASVFRPRLARPLDRRCPPDWIARFRYLWRGIAASAAERFQGFISVYNVQIAIFNNKRLSCRDQNIFWLNIPVGDPPYIEIFKSIRELAKKLLEFRL